MIPFNDHTCLITAAAQGIGRASAIAFARAGYRVVATDIDAGKLKTLEEVANIETRILNVLEPQAVADLEAGVGPVDILFNCAGVVHAGTILDATENELDFALDLNLKAQIRMIRAFLPGMLARKNGCIINMATVASSIKAVPNRFAYSVSKAAVIGLTKSVAADFVSQGIRCNAICPGTVDTPSLQERLIASGDYEKARRDFIARQPIGRLGTPEEVADLAVYLASARYTTGQVHIIDGGWTA